MGGEPEPQPKHAPDPVLPETAPEPECVALLSNEEDSGSTAHRADDDDENAHTVADCAQHTQSLAGLLLALVVVASLLLAAETQDGERTRLSVVSHDDDDDDDNGGRSRLLLVRVRLSRSELVLTAAATAKIGMDRVDAIREQLTPFPTVAAAKCEA